MLKRSEVEKKYCWDLSFYKDENEVNNEFEVLAKEAEKYKQFEGKLSDINSMLEYFKFDLQYDLKINKLAFYVGNRLNADLGDVESIKLSNKLTILGSKLSELTAYVRPEMLELSEEYLNNVIKDPRFADYTHTLKEIIRQKPHKISKENSVLISKMSQFLGASSEIYETLSDSELKFESVKTTDGKTIEVNEAEFSNILQSNDRKVRKDGFESIMNGYKSHIKTFANTLLTDMKEDIFFARLENFDSVKSMELFDEEEPSKVYDILIKNVRKYSYLLKKLVDIKANAMGLKDFAYYDLYKSMQKSEKKYTIEDAQTIITDVLKVMGKEYLNKLDKKLKEQKIDYLPNENKRGGAYSSSVYGLPAVILMNFNKNLDSVYTLIHEMGHTLHSEFSNEYQSQHTCNYTIMAAEVASTVNEMLLYRYLSSKAKTKEEKQAYLFELLDKFRTTIFRQTLFSEFEDRVHTSLENSEVKTFEDLNKLYYDLNVEYYGNKIVLPESLSYEWARIPHFYTPFYVHKYATGLISAIAISKKIVEIKGYNERYLNYLKSGDSKPTVELLKELDVDLTTDAPYVEAFGYLEQEIKNVFGN